MHCYPNVFMAQCHNKEECVSFLLNLNTNLPPVTCALLFSGMCAHSSVKRSSNLLHSAAMAMTTVMSLNDGTFQLHCDLKCRACVLSSCALGSTA